MPRPVQSAALGLLSLLTAKDGGIGPNGLEDNYRAILDARPMIGLGFRSTFTISLVPANINVALAGAPGWYRLNDEVLGIAAGFRCPDSEVWRVIAFGVTLLSVTGSVAITPGWDFRAEGGAAGDLWPIALAPTSTGAGAGTERAVGFTTEFWALPGQGPAFHFAQWAVGVNDGNVDAALTVERYRI